MQRTLHQDPGFRPSIDAAKELLGNSSKIQQDLDHALAHLGDESQLLRDPAEFKDTRDVFTIFGDRSGQWQMLLDLTVLAESSTGLGPCDPSKTGSGSLDFKLKMEAQQGGQAPMPAVSADVVTQTGSFALCFSHSVVGEASIASFGGTVESCAEFLSAMPHRIHYRDAESIACALEAPTIRIPLLIKLSLRTPTLLEDPQFRT